MLVWLFILMLQVACFLFLPKIYIYHHKIAHLELLFHLIPIMYFTEATKTKVSIEKT